MDLLLQNQGCRSISTLTLLFRFVIINVLLEFNYFLFVSLTYFKEVLSLAAVHLAFYFFFGF